MVLSRSCVTPTLPLPQFPVAIALFSLSVMIPVRMAAPTTLPPLFWPALSSWYFMSLTRFLKEVLNRSASIWPANFMTLLP